MTDRERFEVWWYSLPTLDLEEEREIAWMGWYAAWQASRKQALVEIREKLVWNADYGYLRCVEESEGYGYGVSDCIDAVDTLANPEGEQG